jgi:hypothetical protein
VRAVVTFSAGPGSPLGYRPCPFTRRFSVAPGMLDGLLRAGFPGLWVADSVLAVLVGGSVLLVAVWGLRHLVWSVVIALVIIILVTIEGSYRESRKVLPRNPATDLVY